MSWCLFKWANAIWKLVWSMHLANFCPCFLRLRVFRFYIYQTRKSFVTEFSSSPWFTCLPCTWAISNLAAHIHDVAPLETTYELINNNFIKIKILKTPFHFILILVILSCHKFAQPCRSAVARPKLWHARIMISHARVTFIFTRFGLWALKTFVICILEQSSTNWLGTG